MSHKGSFRLLFFFLFTDVYTLWYGIVYTVGRVFFVFVSKSTAINLER